jgi:hypothetical protein
MSAHTRAISPVPCLVGALLWMGATTLICEDAFHGQFSINHALQPLLTAATVCAAVICHHRLASWRLFSGSAFLVLALLGSLATVYGTLSRTATARDGQQADAMAMNRTLAEKGEALEAAKTSAKAECRSLGPKCVAWNQRVDQLTREMAPLRAVAVDPRADAIAKLAELLGQDSKRVRAIVAALDPVILPLFLEVGCILFFAAAFPHRRNRPATERNSEATVTVASRVYTQADALRQFREMREVGAQQFLAQQWGVDKSTVSRWLRSWETQGHIRRQREGKCKQVALPPAGGLMLPHP